MLPPQRITAAAGTLLAWDSSRFLYQNFKKRDKGLQLKKNLHLFIKFINNITSANY